VSTADRARGPEQQPLLDEARRVADAVLFEGYLLYPYRASAAKNQVRWQWGVLMPPAYVRAEPAERDRLHTEFLLDPRGEATLTVRLRFLHVRSRGVERAVGPDGGYTPTPRLEVPDGETTTPTTTTSGPATYLPFDEAEPAEVESVLGLDRVLAAPVDVPVRVAGSRGVEPVLDADGRPAGRLVRRGRPLDAVLRVSAERLPGPYGGVRVTVSVENLTDFPARPLRESALRRALVAAHVLVATSSGDFLSMVDPPEWASVAVKECRNEGVWPVLIGSESRAPVVLASPVILDDAPRVAPESPVDMFDATEIDEILSLRTLTLTDEEKREARATDPRAAALMDHVDAMPPEMFARLHGAIRELGPVSRSDSPATDSTQHDSPPEFTTPGLFDADGWPAAGGVAGPPPLTMPVSAPWWDPGADASVSPETDRVDVGGTSVGRGDTVVLRPGARRADAHDLFLAGRLAHVEAVLSDVDGGAHLAVTLVDDPAADLLAAEGRFLYFRPDEVEPTAPGQGSGGPS